jgi:hypothetical protein
MGVLQLLLDHLMIIPNSNPFVIQSQNLVSHDFGAKLDGKFFKMITESQYENKIGSPVRELSCNALDSHNSVGKGNIPFEIHLPSVYEPWFSVRDFGSGMSDEFVQTTYTTFGASTKDIANDAIGGFGLGSKTPLAYTDSFSVCSIFNGVKSHYSVIYGDTGIPALTAFDSEPTDDPNGVEIKFSVKSDDYRSFSNEVIKQLMFFKVKPTLLNNTFNAQFHEIEYKENFGNFKITNSVSGMWIVQGEVGYRLDKALFAEKIKDKDQLEFFNLYNNAVMFFDIGDIEVTISREGVSYSPHTVEHLEKFVSIHAPIIYGNIKTHIENMSCDWERLCYLNEDYTNRRFAALAGMKFGKDGNTGDMKLSIHGSGSTTYGITLTSNWRVNNIKMWNICSFDNTKKTRAYFNGNEFIINPSKNIRIFIRDVAKSTIGKMKHYISSNSEYNVYMIEHPDGAAKVNAEFIGNIKNYFGGVEIQLASSFPELDRSARIASKNSPVVVYKNDATKNVIFNTESFYHWDRIYDEEEIEGGYFLIYDSFPRINAAINDLEMIKKVVYAGLFDKPIYIIKREKSALLRDNPNFSCPIVKAREIIEENEKKILKSEVQIQRYKFARAVNQYINGVIGSPNASLMIIPEDVNRLPTNSVPARIKKIHKVSERYVARINKMIEEQTQPLLKALFEERIKASFDDQQSVLSKIYNHNDTEMFYEKYPMIKELYGSYNRYGESIKIRSKNMVDYILTVDKATA